MSGIIKMHGELRLKILNDNREVPWIPTARLELCLFPLAFSGTLLDNNIQSCVGGGDKVILLPPTGSKYGHSVSNQ